MKINQFILAAVAAISLFAIQPSLAEWTDQDTKDCWEWEKSSATRTVTTPRWKSADEEAGEGLLEAFGTEYMPNAYAAYQKARATAKEREMTLKENFPNGRESDPTGGTTYQKVAKATAKAVFEMNRRHDELCHFYLMHKSGVITAAELAEKDGAPILVMLPKWDGFYADKINLKELSEAERTFAAKHLPEINTACERLASLLADGRKTYGDLRADALKMDAGRSSDIMDTLYKRLCVIADTLNDVSDLIKQQKMLYDVEEASADDLAKLSQEKGSSLQNEAKRHADPSHIRKLMESKFNWEWRLPPAKQIIRMLVPIPGQYFKIGLSEVTQGQWEGIMGNNPSKFKGEYFPVENVSWDDCQKFVETLNALEDVKSAGLVFRLPTRDEWEFACRAGATGDYCKLANGTEVTKDTLGSVAWFYHNSEMKYNDRGWTGTRNQTHAVGCKKPNAFGLFDMLGNVSEWTSTSKKDYAGRNRYVMGGNFDTIRIEEYILEDMDKERKYDGVGFRVVAETIDDLSAKKRKSVDASNARIEAVKPTLDEMGITTKVVELPGGSQLLMNELLNKGRWMGAFEVTQAQWEAIMGNNPSEFEFGGGDRPVEQVSMKDCKEFIAKLNALDEVKKSGLVFHLPTEKEWQNARRAGLKDKTEGCLLYADGTTVQNFGDVAWFRGNSDNHTHPVGQKKPNAYGLYDILGNVRECVAGKDNDRSWLVLGRGYQSYGVNASERIVPDFEDSIEDLMPDAGFRLAAEDPKVIEAEELAKVAAAEAAEAARIAALNASISSVMPTLKAMGIETRAIELPGGVQLLMNKLPNGMWMGAFEVTQLQWKTIMKENPSEFNDPKCPVETISWNDCRDFMRKLNDLDEVKKSGLFFKLPSKEEWQYACLAGSKGRYCRLSDGTEVQEKTLGDVAWFEDNSGDRTRAVGQKKPNAFGLYDMLGNVEEWTSTVDDFDGGRFVCGHYYREPANQIKGVDFMKMIGKNSRIGPGGRGEFEKLPYRGFRVAAKEEAVQ